MRLTILLPSLNEAPGIRRTIARIPREQLQAMGFTPEILVIDGASTDGTAEAAREAGATVHVDARPGYGRAYKTGLGLAQGDWVATGDADDSYPLDRLPALLAAVTSQALDFATFDRFADLATGSMKGLHKFGNRVLSTTARALFHVRLRDSQSGMWILNRHALSRIPIERLSDGMAFSQEIKLAAFRDKSLRCAELAGTYYPRAGEAKLMSWRDGLGNLRRLWGRRLRGLPRASR